MITLTPDLQKKILAVVGFVVVAGGVLYLELPHGGPTSVTAPTVTVAPVAVAGAKPAVFSTPPGTAVGGAAKRLGTTSAELDPTLRMEPMLITESLVYSGSGRNIFSAGSAPVDIPKPIAPVRTRGSALPVVTLPQGPPPPPPIDLKFFGTATAADGTRRAFLLHGEDVFLASDGDIVQRRYRVVTVSANSILVEDLANNNKQTLPLLAR